MQWSHAAMYRQLDQRVEYCATMAIFQSALVNQDASLMARGARTHLHLSVLTLVLKPVRLLSASVQYHASWTKKPCNMVV
jgi:hypothetical protein